MSKKPNTKNYKENRWWDPIAGLSLFFIVFFAAYALQLTHWTFNLNRITVLASLCVITGMFIGQSKFKKNLSVFLVVSYALCLFLIFFIFSLSTEVSWMDRFAVLTRRFQSVFYQIRKNLPLTDGILFLSFMAVVFCALSIIAGYSYVRNGKPYIIVAFFSAIFFTIQYFLAPIYRKKLIIIFFSFMLVLFSGRMFFLHQKKRWVSDEYIQDRKASSFITAILLLVSISGALLAGGIPILKEKLSPEEGQSTFYSRQIYSRSWERIKNLINPLQPTKKFGEGLFTSILPLGSSRSLADDVIFQVQTPGKRPTFGRNYWQASVYTQYDGLSWRNDPVEFITPDEIDLYPHPENQEEFDSYMFTYQIGNQEIVSPQLVIGIDRDIDIAYHPVGENEFDVIDYINYQRIQVGDHVVVQGGYYDFIVREDMADSYDYPDWVITRYLQLPEGLPGSVQQLAEEITESERSVFNKAIAITEYLRNTLDYSDTVEIPPNMDPIEWFLFTGREGFCNYFATAEVLLLRSIGIPSRLVVGYAQGEKISDKFTYEVRIKDSHSWVEAYFPGQGWIIFEPTPSQPVIRYKEATRTSEGSDSQNLDDVNAYESELEKEFKDLLDLDLDPSIEDIPTESTKPNFWNQKSWIVLPILLLVLSTLLLGILLTRQKPIRIPILIEERLLQNERHVPFWIRGWAHFEKLPTIERNYLTIKRIADLMGISPAKNKTPQETILPIFSSIGLEDSLGKKFLDHYHDTIYGDGRVLYTREIRAIYILTLKLMVRLKVLEIKNKVFKKEKRDNS